MLVWRLFGDVRTLYLRAYLLSLLVRKAVREGAVCARKLLARSCMGLATVSFTNVSVTLVFLSVTMDSGFPELCFKDKYRSSWVKSAIVGSFQVETASLMHDAPEVARPHLLAPDLGAIFTFNLCIVADLV